jgi:hypothetical protein
LDAVADDDPPISITEADLTHSADARAGLATATFTPDPVDSADTSLTIRYADGVSDDNLEILLVNPQSASSWRLRIGSALSTGVGPSPAKQGG